MELKVEGLVPWTCRERQECTRHPTLWRVEGPVEVPQLVPERGKKEQWLVEGIAPAAGSPWIGRIGSLQISSLRVISPAHGFVGCVCCFKTGCCFVVDASLFSQRLRNNFQAAETFQFGTLFLKQVQHVILSRLD